MCSLLSANYRTILLCCAHDIRQPMLTCNVVGKHHRSVGLCNAQRQQGSKAGMQSPKRKLQKFHAVLCTKIKEIKLTCSGEGKHYGRDRLCSAQGQQGSKTQQS